jgi:DmsE family decaheme c-type cytochrome
MEHGMRVKFRTSTWTIDWKLPQQWLQVAAMLTCTLVVLWALGYASPSAAQGSRSTGAAQFTEDGTDSCLRCHGGENMTVMAETAHGKADDPNAPYAQKGCESCHGPGSLHVSRARGGAGFPALIRFGDKETHPAQTAACLDCHEDNTDAAERMEWTGSLHDTPEITCVSCHSMHTTNNSLSNRDEQVESCADCHKDEITNHRRFEQQGIVFDKLTCYDCHDVHQLIGKESE